jgi:transposase InsO family protein
MVVMDQFTRQLIGFAVHAGIPDGPAVCQMFGRIVGQAEPPTYLSSDNDLLFEFQRWKANLRILGITEIKTVPYVPLSHPFVERLIGTTRREFLDQVPFWGALDLQRKLQSFQQYYNRVRVHQSLSGRTLDPPGVDSPRQAANPNNYQWKSHCRGLFQLPVAA